MIPLALSSGIACILAYGQTGSGKTYTMEALEHRIARDLFVAARHVGAKLLDADKQAQGEESTGESVYKDPLDVFEFSVSFMELLGKRGADLLEPVDDLPKYDEIGGYEECGGKSEGGDSVYNLSTSVERCHHRKLTG